MIELNVNGAPAQVEIEPDTPLLWVLRDQLGLTGSKYSCGIGICGACLVSVNGKTLASCVTPVSAAVGREVVTIEGVSGPAAEAIKMAWIAQDTPQCGYCQSGQIMAAAALLTDKPNPTDAEIDDAMSRVHCRCGTYSSIRHSIHRAAKELAK